MADYYLAGPGATLAAALPPHGLTARADRFKTVRIAALTAAGARRRRPPGRAQLRGCRGVGLPRLGKRQARGLQLLAGAPDGLTAPALAERGITGADRCRGSKALGLVAIREERVDRDPFEHAVSAVKPHGRFATRRTDQQTRARASCCRWRPRRRSTSRCCTA